MDTPIMTKKDVCDYLKISASRLNQLIREKIIIPAIIGGSFRFHKDDIKEHLKNSEE